METNKIIYVDACALLSWDFSKGSSHLQFEFKHVNDLPEISIEEIERIDSESCFQDRCTNPKDSAAIEWFEKCYQFFLDIVRFFMSVIKEVITVKDLPWTFCAVTKQWHLFNVKYRNLFSCFMSTTKIS